MALVTMMRPKTRCKGRQSYKPVRATSLGYPPGFHRTDRTWMAYLMHQLYVVRPVSARPFSKRTLVPFNINRSKIVKKRKVTANITFKANQNFVYFSGLLLPSVTVYRELTSTKEEIFLL